jgi:hypothetical protein
MNRRHFATLALSLGVSTVLPASVFALEASPEATGDFPVLDIELTDDGLIVPDMVKAGRTLLRAINSGTMTESHWAMGRFPDAVTEADIEAFFAAQGEDTDALSFDDIEFVGVPDWPQPDGDAVTGIVDLPAGRYMAFKPIADQMPIRFLVEGDAVDAPEPVADFTVDLHDMTIVLPDAAFTSAPVRWKIENTGSLPHDIAVLPVPADFTADDFMALMMMPEDATPPPEMAGFEYLPVAAIGILAPQRISWLDVQLDPGHYMAVCMLPFGTGYPHAMDGMSVFFEVA